MSWLQLRYCGFRSNSDLANFLVAVMWHDTTTMVSTCYWLLYTVGSLSGCLSKLLFKVLLDRLTHLGPQMAKCLALSCIFFLSFKYFYVTRPFLVF